MRIDIGTSQYMPPLVALRCVRTHSGKGEQSHRTKGIDRKLDDTEGSSEGEI